MLLRLKTDHFPQRTPDEFDRRQTNPSPQRHPLFLIVFLLILAIVLWGAKKFIEYDDDGQPQLAEWREAKLLKELEDLEAAEQYALKATQPGNYPCYNCGDQPTIFLHTGETWKYGFTTKGEKGRYQKGLTKMKLIYVKQYIGSITECMKQERIKIYNYALLPENLKRTVPLIRPPGNKNDN